MGSDTWVDAAYQHRRKLCKCFPKEYTRWQYENSENNSAFGFGQSSQYSFAWVFTNTATYKKTFGKHAVEVLIGQEALNTGAGWNTDQSGLNPFSWDPDYINMSNLDSRNPPNSNQFLGVNFSSLFGQVKYTFNEKYIISGVLRRDGSSRFGSNNRYGVFPAISGAWRISAENFMQSVSLGHRLEDPRWYVAKWVTQITWILITSTSCMVEALAILPMTLMERTTRLLQDFYRTRIGNKDAKWETSVTSNIGIDGQFFDGKLDVIVDFWRKETEDLLLHVPVTATAGY